MYIKFKRGKDKKKRKSRGSGLGIALGVGGAGLLGVGALGAGGLLLLGGGKGGAAKVGIAKAAKQASKSKKPVKMTATIQPPAQLKEVKKTVSEAAQNKYKVMSDKFKMAYGVGQMKKTKEMLEDMHRSYRGLNKGFAATSGLKKGSKIKIKNQSLDARFIKEKMALNAKQNNNYYSKKSRNNILGMG